LQKLRKQLRGIRLLLPRGESFFGTLQASPRPEPQRSDAHQRIGELFSPTNCSRQTRSEFDAALAPYESRLDKDYSLTDRRSPRAGSIFRKCFQTIIISPKRGSLICFRSAVAEVLDLELHRFTVAEYGHDLGEGAYWLIAHE
jgi:hypothetical protein